MSKRVLLLIIISIILLTGITYANNNDDMTIYNKLYADHMYKSLVNKLVPIVKAYESGEENFFNDTTISHARNLVADSYRMLGEYTQASQWYASTVDGYDDPYAEYCFYILESVGIISKYEPVSGEKKVDTNLHYTGWLGPNPVHEYLLTEILSKLKDSTSLLDKRRYFKELVSYDKNNDWVTNLTKFCAGNLSFDSLLSSIPKEYIGTVLTYAGLSFETSGNQFRARELYQNAIALKNSSNIELLLAANRLGLFSLKIQYTTEGSAGNEIVKLTDVFPAKAFSAKVESNRVYGVQNLLDGDPTTTWVPSSKKSGIGEWVEISFDDPMPINSLIVTNGYAKSNTAFKNNNRVKTATLEFSDGSKQKVSLQDSMKPQEIKIGKSTQKIRLYIDEVYKGEKYDDTCLSGIDLQFDTPKE